MLSGMLASAPPDSQGGIVVVEVALLTGVQSEGSALLTIATWNSLTLPQPASLQLYAVAHP